MIRTMVPCYLEPIADIPNGSYDPLFIQFGEVFHSFLENNPYLFWGNDF